MVCLARPVAGSRPCLGPPVAARESAARACHAPCGTKENRNGSICVTVPSVDVVDREPATSNRSRPKNRPSGSSAWSFSGELQRARDRGSPGKACPGELAPCGAGFEDRCPSCEALRRRAAHAESVAQNASRMHTAVLEELQDLRVAHAAAEEEVQHLRSELHVQAASQRRERELWHAEIDDFATEFLDLRAAATRAVSATGPGRPVQTTGFEKSERSAQTLLLPRFEPPPLVGEILQVDSDTLWRRRLRARSLDHVRVRPSLDEVALHSNERRRPSVALPCSFVACSPEDLDACWSSVDVSEQNCTNIDARGVPTERKIPSAYMQNTIASSQCSDAE